MRDVCPYVERVPEYDIRDGVVCVDFGSWSLYMPLRVFKLGQARAAKIVREYEASGKVLPFRGGR